MAIVPGAGEKWLQMEDDSFIPVNETWKRKEYDIEEENYFDLEWSVNSGKIEPEPLSAKIFYWK